MYYSNDSRPFSQNHEKDEPPSEQSSKILLDVTFQNSTVPSNEGVLNDSNPANAFSFTSNFINDSGTQNPNKTIPIEQLLDKSSALL